MKKKKICICSDTIQSITGLGKTALRIAKGFHDANYDVCYFVITGQDSDKKCFPFYGEQYKDLFRDFNIYNCQISHPERVKLFDEFIYQEKPDIVLTLLDPWYLDQIHFSIYRNTFTWIAYCLFETPMYPEFAKVPNYIKNDFSVKSIFDPLRNADICIPVSKMGEKILRDKQIKCTENIYLGVDFDLRCNDELTKEQVFGSAVTNDTFLFMTVGRNSERKKIDKVMEAFAQFMKSHKDDKDKYKLYIHTNHFECCTGTDLISLGMQLGIIDNVLFPVCFDRRQVMLDKDLYKRYKVCDAYIGLSAGEGFGYGFMEALMHNKPVIYLNYGAHKEYCVNHGYPVSVESYYNARDIYMQWALPKLSEAVKHMHVCVDSKHKVDADEYIKNNFDWDLAILPKLIKVVEDNYTEKKKINFKLNRVNV